jgi:hypothetical protein
MNGYNYPPSISLYIFQRFVIIVSTLRCLEMLVITTVNWIFNTDKKEKEKKE